jgi:hypothetical protein
MLRMVPAAVDPSLLSDMPAVTTESMLHAARSLLASAEQACTVAERLEELAERGQTAHEASDTLLAAEQIGRAMALLNEAQGALLVAVVLCPIAAGMPAVAHGDTIIQQKQAQLVRVKRQVHRLDLRVGRIDERYNAAVIRTRVLSRQIAKTTLALNAEAARLRADQALLADLLVAAYKGQLTDDTNTLLAGSDDVGAAASAYETRNRFDGAVAVRIASLADGWFSATYVGATRIE